MVRARCPSWRLPERISSPMMIAPNFMESDFRPPRRQTAFNIHYTSTHPPTIVLECLLATWRLLGGSAVDIAFQLLDGPLLLGDHFLHQVADREHADQPLALGHRQMADALLGHERHAFLHRLAGMHGDD